MKRVLVTGARDWPPGLQWEIWQALDMVYDLWGPIVVVHGKADGADTMAKNWVTDRRSQGWDVDEEGHAYISEMGKMGGHVRNQNMVNLGADLCLAFITRFCRGTRDCYKRAERAEIPLVKFFSEEGLVA